MKKRIVALALVVLMLTVAVIGGTMAYFTDTDEAENVFTMGEVSIMQYEHQRTEEGFVELDTQESLKLMPVIHTGSGRYPNANPTNGGTGEKFMVGNYYSALDVQDSTGVTAAERWIGVWIEPNVVDKFVSVFNDGNNDVYVRTVVAVPAAIDQYIVLNCVEGVTWNKTEVSATIDSTEYQLYVFTYIRGDGILQPGTSTGPSLAQVLMYKDVEQEDVKAFQENGFEILVASQAVQADGFAETFEGAEYVAVEALDEAFGAISATNHPWAE